MAGQRVQCIQINITDDENVLEEELESFKFNLTALESFVAIPREHESIVIDIYEDSEDSESILITIDTLKCRIVVMNQNLLLTPHLSLQSMVTEIIEAYNIEMLKPTYLNRMCL